MDRNDLLGRIYESDITSPLLAKRGSFVVSDVLGTGLIFASIFKEKPGNYALICPNQYLAQKLYEFLLNFLNENDVVFFPSDELLRAEALSSSRELLSQRLYALHQLSGKEKKILVTHPSALLRFLPDPKRFKEETLHFKVGDSFDLSELKTKLMDLGYKAVSHVDKSLEFASRGDILDIYSVSYLDPIRLEFFGDEIESIRLFSSRSQESKAQLKEVYVLPATDIFLNDEELTSFAEKANERLAKDCALLKKEESEALKQNFSLALQDFIERNYRSELYRYYGYALGKANSVLSYFSPDLVFIVDKESCESSSSQLVKESVDYLQESFLKGLSLSRLGLYMGFEQAVPDLKKVVCSSSFATSSDSHEFLVHSINVPSRNLASVVPLIETYLSSNENVILCLPDAHQKATVISFLEDAKIPFEEVSGLSYPSKERLGISGANISEGFEIPSLRVAVLTSAELFGHRVVRSKFTARFKNSQLLRSYEDLNPGDYVVHETNGIGQFIDVTTLEIEGVHRDFLHIAYAGNETLYVPLEQFRLVRKYAGREGAAPRLSHLSSHEWKKQKSKIQERVSELAERLIALYGARAKERGFSFPPDDELQRQFEDEFAYPLTDDQQKAVDDIKGDMESSEIMDRLVCGDVGFGKTEIAFRAAFKAIDAGKQVAMLVPTTLLARQHYEVASNRFASFGIRLGLLSRMVSASEQKKVIDGLADGSVDFVIGTHRLLSKSIAFKDLGLLIVDEEQRFGVEQKEKIKELKNDVDVLTLSATPIPRTLQMSLVGIRPISEINTAPPGRMPIQTYVTPFKQDVADELVEKELVRGGQVFYLHNNVESIYAVAMRMGRRIPKAKIGVVHGQMDREESEEVMSQFYDGQINVLICTSIVENGIDVPNANMIIVEDADKFGLAQLYQIKGRVGRGNRIAYAYLMYKSQKNMNEDASKRLKAIQEFTELGSGYKIAQRDLMIRGAGDILGPEQAGFIDSVGLDLYLKMLNEAVEEKTKGIKPKERTPRKLFDIDAYIPKTYADSSDKIELYQELDDVTGKEGLETVIRKMKDVYGRLPEEVALLIQKKRIDILLDNVEFEAVEENQKSVDVYLASVFSSLDGMGYELFNALSGYLEIFRMSYLQKKLRLIITKREKWLDDLEHILNLIHDLAAKHGLKGNP